MERIYPKSVFSRDHASVSLLMLEADAVLQVHLDESSGEENKSDVESWHRTCMTW